MSRRRLTSISVGTRGRLVSFVVALAVPFLGVTAPAFAQGPAWTIASVAEPTNLVPNDNSGGDTFVLTAVNTGNAVTDGSTIKISDALPRGLTATAISGADYGGEGGFGTNLTCPPATLECTYGGVVAPGDMLQITITVNAPANLPSTVTNSATISGGGAATASASDLTTVSATPASSGASGFAAGFSNAQAGAHAGLTTIFTVNQRKALVPAGTLKDVNLDVPLGAVGNPTVVPRCNMNAVVNNACPADTAVGVGFATVGFAGFPGASSTLSGLVYNIVPYNGEPAAFALDPGGLVVRLDTSVTSEGNYAIHVSAQDLTEAEPILTSAVTLWGVPAQNNGKGPDTVLNGQSFGGPGSGVDLPFLTNPTKCGEPLETGLSVDFWQEPGVRKSPLPAMSPALTGCNLLSFEPSISVQPDTLQAGSPAGYEVHMHVPQSESPSGLATPDLEDASVTLPVGTVVSPSAADGLQACSEAQLGLHLAGPASCPNASQIGTVEVVTPLLSSPLEGGVYLAEQGHNPFGSLLAVYLVAEGSGVRIKLAGEVHADPVTGQLTTTFTKNPQLPFSDLRLRLDGGPRAPLANPSVCGPAVTTSALTPYSSATPAAPTSSFEVGGCPPQRFAPTFTAGTTNNQAGGYSPFSVTLSRTDQDQELRTIAVQAPPGVEGMLSHVPLCPEPQAAHGACPAASQIGTTTVGAGPGPTPFYLGGQVFLTGPYNGGPFGLSIVVALKAGPIDLGVEVVRAAIRVDPHTAQITVVSDPLPTIRDGIPFQIKTVNVNVDRPEFTFNPTDCKPLAVTGTIASTNGAGAAVSSRFQAANCAALAFAPQFSVSTRARTSHAGGASLDVKVAEKGGQANLHEVKVQLPKRLPARLTTLQKACADTVFEANPAKCPAASDVGTAVARTPVLPVPVAGPAYLVSHGGRAFPDLEIVLQGDGVTIVLDGGTNIRKGITTSTFATIPDAPISSFELRLPEGPHSALAANGSLCAKPLSMPTLMVGQNGAQISQTTRIKVTGCPAKRRTKKGK